MSAVDHELELITKAWFAEECASAHPLPAQWLVQAIEAMGLAIAFVDWSASTGTPEREPALGVTGVNYSFSGLPQRADATALMQVGV